MNIKTAAAAGFAAVLLLAGCSSDSDDASDEATTAATPTASETMDSDMESSPSEGASDAGTIVEVASGNDDFSTLVAAVQAADLVDTLSGDGPFTVFAPTNEAFEALPEGVLDALLEEENKDALTSILTYHVVSGKVMAADVEPGDVDTVEGSSIEIKTDDGVMVNDANVTATDIEASNGVIHVIDAVLVPESVDPAELTS